mgnify:CR=1 FL=1
MGKNPWIAGILNFFLLGAGYIYNGKRIFLGVGLTLGALLLTYLEQIKIKEAAPDLFILAFISFFVLAVSCAYDGFKEAKEM